MGDLPTQIGTLLDGGDVMDIHLKTFDSQDSRALNVSNQGSCLGLQHSQRVWLGEGLG